MQEDRLYIAPLQIKKTIAGTKEEEEEDYHRLTTTTLAGENDFVASAELEPARPRFQNYLRAAYPFQPSAGPSPSTVTLPLHAGDIVLIHSIHTNGWADGTLLETGERGWLPTNYCEPYDYATMRPLLRALTDFWDIIKSGSDSNVDLFNNSDYIRGIVAGVRFLLEKSDCLTRDAVFVKQHDNIRRIRKALLSDLSMLVKAAKQLQDLAGTQDDLLAFGNMLDEIIFKAFKIVTRAVKFFDAWVEEIAFARTVQVTGLYQSNSFTPAPAEYSARTLGMHNLRHETIAEETDQTYLEYDHGHEQRQSAAPSVSGTRLSQGQTAQRLSEDPTIVATNRPVSFASTRVTLTHRMSYTNRAIHRHSGTLASEKLTSAYDGFLGVLASFVGSHIQSRSSSELLLATQQAVRACRELLAVVETLIEHDYNHDDSLLEAKDSMYDKITELVHAARQVFGPLHAAEDDLEYLPDEGMHLVQAATACVSGAGKCVAKARILLEEIGDFELDRIQNTDVGQSSPRAESSVRPSPQKTVTDISPIGSDASGSDDDRARHPSSDLPRLEIPRASGVSQTDGADVETILTPSTATSSEMTEHARSLTPVSPPSNTRIPLGSEAHNPHLSLDKPVTRNIVHSTGSSSTADSSVRYSGPSVVSMSSTRATSPDDQGYGLSDQLEPASEKLPACNDEADDGEIEMFEYSFAHELIFNQEGRVIGGTLNAVIERLTAHDSAPDAFFVSTIFLTFRLFASPESFTRALQYRFNYVGQTPRIAGPVRLRVYNVFKGWMESHWRHDCDNVALPLIANFAEQDLKPILSAAGLRLIELTEKVAKAHAPLVPRVISSMGKTSTSSAAYISPDTPLPSSIISKSQLTALKTWKMGGAAVSILDFDALELARQITLKEASIFCSILPEELLATEFTKQSNSLAVNVRAMSTLSTDIANLVTDSILQLEEPKKRAAVIKQWIKISTKCLDLNNYDAIFAIICSLNSSTILRLKRTWDVVSQKTKAAFEELKKVIDVSRNYAVLRQRIQGHVPPCLPFVGMYLTDLTFVDHGNQATRQLNVGDGSIAVINLDKHMKTAKIISDLQRFQIPYRLTEVSELQTWMQDELIRVRSSGEKNFQNHYRRSLVLEPREQMQRRPSPNGASAGISRDKERFDFLAWTHLGKDKPIGSTA